jgi:hypothetical protein
MPTIARMGRTGDLAQEQAKDARRAALMEARDRLVEAESLVAAGEPGGSEALEQARSALARSSSYPPAAVPADSEDEALTSDPPNSDDEAASSLRSRLSAFLKSLR